MRGPDNQRLETLVYAALLGQCTWERFLEELSTGLPNGKAILYFHDMDSGRGAFALQAGIDVAEMAKYSAYYSSINPWMPMVAKRPLGVAMAAEAMLPRHELLKTEYYNDYLRPRDVSTGVGITVRRDAACHFMLSVNGKACPEEAQLALGRRMEAVMPHLREAFDLYGSGRAGNGSTLTWAGMGGGLQIGILQVNPDLKIVSANPAALKIMARTGALWTDRTGRLGSSEPAVLQRIEAVLRDWFRADPVATARSFLVRIRDSRLPLRVTVLAPLGTDADRFFQGPRCTLLLEDPNRDVAGAASEFANLHGLTRAEARLVATLAGGKGLGEAAAVCGITYETARSHLKQVFSKTGLTRQTELIREIYALAGTVVGP